MLAVRNAGHVDDHFAAVRFHVLSAALPEKGAAEVHVHHLVVRFCRGFLDAPAAEYARIVHRDIHTAEVMHRCCKQRLDVGFHADIRPDGDGLPTFRGYRLCRLVPEALPPSSDPDFRTFFGEPWGNCLADNAVAAGDNGDFSDQTGHVNH